MCDSIIFNSGKEIGTIRQFQDEFKVDAKKYGFDGREQFLDCCMCSLDLEQFFRDMELKFVYECGEWEQ
jgi:hypothetical protein